MVARKSIFVLTLLLTFVLLVSGCGKEEEPASDTNVSEPVAAVSQPTRGDASKGEKVFQSTCVACHGPDAKGIQGLGKSLHPSDSEFISTRGDDEMVEFIKTGRQPDDPLNTTGIAMPPKGGNPAISDDDLYHLVAWLRTLN